MLNEDLYAGAYYLCGYVVECALKACIAKSTKRYDFPDKSLAFASHVHNLKDLLGIAGLQQKLNDDADTDPALGDNWAVAVNWREASRYDPKIDAKAARDLYQAVSDRKSGVLKWLRIHW